MDTIKQFLETVCNHSDGEYRYERLENLAEIYKDTDPLPIAIIEWSSTLGHFIVRFRIGIPSLDIAKLTRDMATEDNCLLFDEDFIIHPDYGYLYGDEAAQAFLQQIQGKIQDAQEKDVTDGAMYISTEPIFAFGSGFTGKTNIEQLWDLYDEDDSML